MYQVLYRKWRPKTFADVVGQPHVTETLKNELISGRIAHAYLFTGSRGTGKTTCAKIFAKAVNCLHPVDGNPCCECEICRGIEDESIMDVTEMDAASNRKIEDIRDLLEEIRYTPAQAKYRVFIVDEVHMLTTEAFNALLKTLEEPPSYGIFILATTEPHKLPATILSRCQRFDFHRVTPQAICDRLQYIAREEGGDMDDEAGLMIARLADGGMRDALSILDQAMGKSRQVNALTVCETVGMAGTGYIHEMAGDIAKRDPAALMRLINELYANSKDMIRLCDELIGYFRSIMILSTVKDSDGLIVASEAELAELKQMAAGFTPARAIEILNLLQSSYEKMTRGVNKRVEMETALIRICSIPDSGTPASQPSPPSNQVRQQSAPDQSAAMNSLLSRVEALERMVRSGLLQGKPAVQTVPIYGSTSEPGSKASGEKGGASVNVRELSDSAKLYGEWSRVIEALQVTNQAAYSVLADSRAFINGKYLLIETGGFGRDMLRNSQVKESIKGIVRQISGIDCRLGPYTPSGAVQYNSTEQNYPSGDTTFAAAEKIIQRAQEAGVEVEEN
ncbi:MAG: DNA polymerase III subunit gamma/tau [Clostridia bacterium]|nr:DNA polymerase III subunit gamma/tau [Clostridia bacterium]